MELEREKHAMTDNRTHEQAARHKCLAHPSPLERHNAPVIVFVTLTIEPRGAFLANGRMHAAFRGACADADAWSVGRYVIMPDHIHLFCSPAQSPLVGIKRWATYFKRRITIRLNASEEDGSPGVSLPSGNAAVDPEGKRVQHEYDETRAPPRGWRWQADCWDVQMRHGQQYREKWDYVRLNPVRAGLVPTPEAWPWQGEWRVLSW